VTIIEDIRFPGPDEVEWFWAFDKMHAPRPIHPLSQDLIMDTIGRGFTRAQEEYACPVVVDTQALNHYFYVSFHPHPDPAVIEERMTRYEANLAEKVPVVGERWASEWLPMIRLRNEAERDVDYAPMSDSELSEKLLDMTAWMEEMWYVHGHINFALLSGAALSDMYVEVMNPEDPTESYQILQGHHTRSVDAARGIWTMARIAKNSPTLKSLFESLPPKELVEKLKESDEGRDYLAKLDDFLYEFGWRSDAVYDLADVPWLEDPAIPLGNIARYIDLPDSQDPDIQYRRGVKLREELTAKVRAKLADQPERLAKFDELYEAAKYSYPVTEDHAFYIDQMGVVCFRRFVVAVGERLATKGCFDDPADVFCLYTDEVQDALAHGGDFRSLVQQRKDEMAAAAEVTPPDNVGYPPPPPAPGDFIDPFMDALVVRLLGVKPPSEEAEDPVVIDGVAGAPGQYTGIARVVRSLEQAGDIEEGEVMVCEMTLPPWVPLFALAGAVVADVGGVMSHCAIVAREFDIPAVVGSVNGTTRIQTGQTITVDGTNGNVYLDGRDL
jgi:phosphohistidine swiveling domain-containing protein